MTPVVVDASVGVKWFRDEPGAKEARDLLAAHGRGEVTIVVPSLFVYELISVASRDIPADDAEELWHRFLDWRIHVSEVTDPLVRGALDVRQRLGCTFYDAVAPALAESLHAPLYSADRRAHRDCSGVVLVE